MSETTVNADRGSFALDTGSTALLIAELLACSGGKLGQSEILDDVAEVSELYVSAATLELWRSGAVKFGWDTEAEELVLCDKSQLDDQDGRLIFKGGNDQ